MEIPYRSSLGAIGRRRSSCLCEADQNKHRMPLLSPRVVRSHSKSERHVSSKFESLDYDVWSNDLLIKEEQSLGFNHIIETNVIRWCLYFMVGLFTGFVAAFTDLAINLALDMKNELFRYYLQSCTDGNCHIIWYTLWLLQFIIPVFISVLIVVYIAPNAAGSGIPPLIAFLNGVQAPEFDTLKIFLVKILGLILISSAGIAVGKEGPYIHIGAVTGSLVITGFKILGLKLFPIFIKRHFMLYSIQEKRDLITAGCASGFAVAFGSPVGGTLLSLEEGVSFWNVHLMWRIFFCAIIAVYTFNSSSRYLHYSNEVGGQQGERGLFSFGNFAEGTFDYNHLEFPLFILTGVIGGLLGAFWIWVTTKVDHYRKKYTQKKFLQIVDALIIALLTGFVSLITVSIIRDCRPISEFQEESVKAMKRGCCNGTFNQVTYFWLKGQESTIQQFFHGGPNDFQISTLIMYIFLYFVLFIITFGIQVPAGFFIPAIVLGAGWGRLVGWIAGLINPQQSSTFVSKYSVLGAGAMIGGIFRITLSLATVMIEGTGSLAFSLPIMITVYITKWIGDFFTEGIFETQIHALGLPILPSEPPVLTSDILAQDLMNKSVVAFPKLVNVDQIVSVLKGVAHQGFPVVHQRVLKYSKDTETHQESFGELHGFILRSQLLTLLLTKSFTPPQVPEEVRHMLKLFRKYEYHRINIHDIMGTLTEEERNMSVDLSPYMNRSPYSVPATRTSSELVLTPLYYSDSEVNQANLFMRQQTAKSISTDAMAFGFLCYSLLNTLSASLMVMPFQRIFRLLRSLGLRHVVVVNKQNEVIGIISRKDLAKFRLWRHATSMGLQELRIS